MYKEETFKNADEVYKDVITSILMMGNAINKTRELLNYSFVLNDPTKSVVHNKIRDLSLEYLFGELEWYLTGSNKLEDINKYSKFWNNISDDGITSNSAYGYILKEKYGFDQIQWCIDELKRDPNSRRAVAHIRQANPNHETKDTPCTLSLQFFIRENKLTLITNMRSNDVWFGLPYDIFFFTALQKIVSNSLTIKMGDYIHNAGSIHIYDKDNLLCNDIAFKQSLVQRKTEIENTKKMNIIWEEEFFDKLLTWDIYKDKNTDIKSHINEIKQNIIERSKNENKS